MKICPKCNRQCDDNAAFCPDCGTPFPQQQYNNSQQYNNGAMVSRETTLLPDLESLREVSRCVSYSASLPVASMGSTG